MPMRPLELGLCCTCVKKDIPRNLFAAKNALLEGFSVELNLRNSKWSQSSQKHDRKACGWSKC